MNSAPKRPWGCTAVTVARACCALVEADEAGDVDVGHAVAVGQAEVFVVQVSGRAFDAAAGHRVFAGVEQRHAPRFDRRVVHLHLVRRDVERDVRHVQEVVREVLLDDVAAVAEADHEVVDAGLGVDLHDVPEIGLPPISIIGFGLSVDSSLIRVPRPPARMTAFNRAPPTRLPPARR